MARTTRRANSSTDADAPLRIRSDDYTLTIHNGPNAFSLDLIARGDDGKQYTLQVDRIGDRTELVQMILRKLADIWPAYDWHFEADQARRITRIR